MSKVINSQLKVSLNIFKLYKLKPSIVFSILIYCSISAYSQKADLINRKEYYKALGSEDIELIDNQLKLLHTDGETKGFVGALWMRKAGLVFFVTEKLSLFRKGSSILDAAIKEDSKNIELRFLRLMVQEQCPRILNYRKNIEEDAALLKINAKLLPAETRKVLLSYCKQSEILLEKDFKMERREN